MIELDLLHIALMAAGVLLAAVNIVLVQCLPRKK